MFANFLIGLREGLEAALVVGILLAYLVKTGRTEARKALWLGVGAAVTLSLAVGAALTFGTSGLDEEAEETFGGVMSLVAVGFVTWMVFWMKRTARDISGNLQGRLDTAIGFGARAIAAVAFIAVAREGLETSLFIWAAVQSTGSGTAPVVGAALGLAAAVLVGALFYRGAVNIDLRKFFTWTGAALVVIAAGVLAYSVHELQEAGVLPGEDAHAFDLTSVIPPDSWYGSLIKGIFNLSAAPSQLELLAWFAYLLPVMFLFLRASKRPVGTER